uniref:Frenatin-3 n=1 Tax=Nyctimystes infrafrenatus TaxID=61195 RepID=FRE3_NYCIN|nr:RecName: Full=Frenatin-3; Flags: Precursor [Nyctimystes infrafrenatus]CAI77673.1 frenatin 3 precursor [Nyctimystes infrafrenatus]
MHFLKKSIFLVLFLGLVSLSICEKEKREDQNEEEVDENEEESEEKRGLMSVLGHAVGNVLGGLFKPKS